MIMMSNIERENTFGESIFSLKFSYMMMTMMMKCQLRCLCTMEI